MAEVPSYLTTDPAARHQGIWAWLLTTDHKRIALLYLFAVMFWFLLATVSKLEIQGPTSRRYSDRDYFIHLLYLSTGFCIIQASRGPSVG